MLAKYSQCNQAKESLVIWWTLICTESNFSKTQKSCRGGVAKVKIINALILFVKERNRFKCHINHPGGENKQTHKQQQQKPRM